MADDAATQERGSASERSPHEHEHEHERNSGSGSDSFGSLPDPPEQVSVPDPGSVPRPVFNPSTRAAASTHDSVSVHREQGDGSSYTTGMDDAQNARIQRLMQEKFEELKRMMQEKFEEFSPRGVRRKNLQTQPEAAGVFGDDDVLDEEIADMSAVDVRGIEVKGIEPVKTFEGIHPATKLREGAEWLRAVGVQIASMVPRARASKLCWAWLKRAAFRACQDYEGTSGMRRGFFRVDVTIPAKLQALELRIRPLLEDAVPKDTESGYRYRRRGCPFTDEGEYTSVELLFFVYRSMWSGSDDERAKLIQNARQPLFPKCASQVAARWYKWHSALSQLEDFGIALPDLSEMRAKAPGMSKEGDQASPEFQYERLRFWSEREISTTKSKAEFVRYVEFVTGLASMIPFEGTSTPAKAVIPKEEPVKREGPPKQAKLTLPPGVEAAKDECLFYLCPDRGCLKAGKCDRIHNREKLTPGVCFACGKKGCRADKHPADERGRKPEKPKEQPKENAKRIKALQKQLAAMQKKLEGKSDTETADPAKRAVPRPPVKLMRAQIAELSDSDSDSGPPSLVSDSEPETGGGRAADSDSEDEDDDTFLAMLRQKMRDVAGLPVASRGPAVASRGSTVVEKARRVVDEIAEPEPVMHKRMEHPGPSEDRRALWDTGSARFCREGVPSDRETWSDIQVEGVDREFTTHETPHGEVLVDSRIASPGIVMERTDRVQHADRDGGVLCRLPPEQREQVREIFDRYGYDKVPLAWERSTMSISESDWLTLRDECGYPPVPVKSARPSVRLMGREIPEFDYAYKNEHDARRLEHILNKAPMLMSEISELWRWAAPDHLRFERQLQSRLEDEPAHVTIAPAATAPHDHSLLHSTYDPTCADCLRTGQKQAPKVRGKSSFSRGIFEGLNVLVWDLKGEFPPTFAGKKYLFVCGFLLDPVRGEDGLISYKKHVFWAQGVNKSAQDIVAALHVAREEFRLGGVSWWVHSDHELAARRSEEYGRYLVNTDGHVQFSIPRRSNTNAMAESLIAEFANLLVRNLRASALDPRWWDVVAQTIALNYNREQGLPPLINETPPRELGLLGTWSPPEGLLPKRTVEPRAILVAYAGIERTTTGGVHVAYADFQGTLHRTIATDASCRWMDRKAFQIDDFGLREFTAPREHRDGIQMQSAEYEEDNGQGELKEGEYHVDRLVGYKRERGRDWFRVQWVGYPEATWEPGAGLKGPALEREKSLMKGDAFVSPAAPIARTMRSPHEPEEHPQPSGQVQHETDIDEFVKVFECREVPRVKIDHELRAISLKELREVETGVRAELRRTEPASARVQLLPVRVRVKDALRVDAANVDRPGWIKAIETEMGALFENGVLQVCEWSEVTPEDDLLPALLLLEWKDDGTRQKARLVGCGNFQRVEGFQCYAPKVEELSWLSLFIWGLQSGAHIFLIDISTAYLQTSKEHSNVSRGGRRTFLRMPWGANVYFDPDKPEPTRQVLEVLKSIYGLRTADRAWADTLATWLVEDKDFKRMFYDAMVFVNAKRGLVLCVYTDDLPLIALDHAEGVMFCGELECRFALRRCERLGTEEIVLLSRGLSLVGEGKERKLRITMSKYLRAILDVAGFGCESKSVKGLNPKHFTREFLFATDAALLAPEELTELRSGLGGLGYAAQHMRYDLLAPCGILAQGQAAGTAKHLDGLREVQRFVLGTLNRAIEIAVPEPEVAGPRNFDIDCYWDASVPVAERSRNGLAIFVNGGVVNAAASTQTTVSTNTYEAEVVAGSWMAKFGIAAKNTLGEIADHFQVKATLTFVGDNQASNLFASGACSMRRLKHLCLADLYIKAAVAEGDIPVRYVESAKNPANLCTKVLGRQELEEQTLLLGMIEA